MCRLGSLGVVLLFALAACAGPAASPTTAPTAPPASPAGASPTVAPAQDVGFDAADGGHRSGRWYGTGTTVVVLSNMGDNDPGAWDAFAPLLAERGYGVLTYRFRDIRDTSASIAGTVADLTGAIAFVRGRGATRIVLIGASLGGMATAKVAGTAGAAAIVIIA